MGAPTLEQIHARRHPYSSDVDGEDRVILLASDYEALRAAAEQGREDSARLDHVLDEWVRLSHDEETGERRICGIEFDPSWFSCSLREFIDIQRDELQSAATEQERGAPVAAPCHCLHEHGPRCPNYSPSNSED